MSKHINRLCSIIFSLLIITSSVFLSLGVNAAQISDDSVSTQSRSWNFSGYSLSGKASVDMANIAQAQNNKTQSQLGYTEAWCANFVSDCAKIAGQEKAIPFNGLVSSLYSAVLNAGGYTVSYAEQGDLVFYKNPNTGGLMHVGIMLNNTTAISGNYWLYNYSQVCTHKYTSYYDEYGTKCQAIFVRPNYNGNNPTGYVDSISGGTGVIKIRGWAFDTDDINAQLNIHVYIGGPAGDQNAEGIGWVTANTYRPDVHNVYGCGQYHGYDVTIPTTKTGTQNIYIYAINVGIGNNILIGSGTVYIAPDTERPTIVRTYLSEITHDSYRVCVVPKDNAGIKRVSVATWSQSKQRDIIWHDCLFNGSETYYIDLKRSDYSKTNNSLYYNHVYVYDYAGNNISAEINMDYRVSSDTGNTIDDGEYRIVTCVDENKALDIDCGQSDDGTNIQIYSNLNESNQTFDLEYIGNGFYTIISHNNGKSIDVSGDTYENGTNVVLNQYHSGANQQWIIKPTDDGYYRIIARSNGLALDVVGACSENGTNVQMYTINNSLGQKWKLRRVIKPDMVSVKNVSLLNNNLDINPEIDVVIDNQKLILNKDYKVDISFDIEKKNGIAKITGIGNYCDSVTTNFKIQQYTLGDINSDGKISVNDVTEIQMYISQSKDFSDEQKMLADYNQDGIIDVLDVTDIQQFIAKS